LQPIVHLKRIVIADKKKKTNPPVGVMLPPGLVLPPGYVLPAGYVLPPGFSQAAPSAAYGSASAAMDAATRQKQGEDICLALSDTIKCSLENMLLHAFRSFVEHFVYLIHYTPSYTLLFTICTPFECFRISGCY